MSEMFTTCALPHHSGADKDTDSRVAEVTIITINSDDLWWRTCGPNLAATTLPCRGRSRRTDRPLFRCPCPKLPAGRTEAARQS